MLIHFPPEQTVSINVFLFGEENRLSGEAKCACCVHLRDKRQCDSGTFAPDPEPRPLPP